jgi:hypothetical protein
VKPRDEEKSRGDQSPSKSNAKKAIQKTTGITRYK